MADIRVSPEVLAAEAAKFGTQSEHLGEVIHQVTNSIENLRAAWKSDASISFDTLMNEWRRDVDNIHQVLLEVAQNVKGAGISYSELDTDISKGFR